MWIKLENGNYSYSKWEPEDSTGYTEVTESDQLYIDYQADVTTKETAIQQKQERCQKADLQATIDGGEALSLDMSEEQAVLDALMA